MRLHRTNKHFLGKNAPILYTKTPRFAKIMVFYLSLYYIFVIFAATQLKFPSLSRFLDRNVKPRKYAIPYFLM